MATWSKQRRKILCVCVCVTIKFAQIRLQNPNYSHFHVVFGCIFVYFLSPLCTENLLHTRLWSCVTRTVCLFTKYCYFIGNLHWKLKTIMNGVRVIYCTKTIKERKWERREERMKENELAVCVCVCASNRRGGLIGDCQNAENEQSYACISVRESENSCVR